MGNQACCLDRPKITENDEVYKLKLQTVDTDQPQDDPIQVPGLSRAAWETYKKLKAKTNNDQFLNVYKLSNQANQNKGQLIKKYKKIPGHDAQYYGQWNHDEPNGKGKALLSNGSFLVGVFTNGYCSGQYSYQIFPNGSYYSGNIELGIKNGRGKLVNNVLQYNGNWLNNLPHGQGMQIYKNGDKYIGHFDEGLKEGHQCIFIWKQHELYSQYKGSFIKGKIQGEGTLTLKNTSTIHGKFHENQIDGTIFSEKYKFKGTAKDGQIIKGDITILKGHQVYSGNFQDGQLHGECTHKNDKHRAEQCYFFRGKKFKKVVGFTDKQLQNIAKIIQTCYTTVERHNEAIQYLNNQLPNYQSKYVEPYENIFYADKYIVVEIHDKVLFIKEQSKQKSVIISRKYIPQ